MGLIHEIQAARVAAGELAVVESLRRRGPLAPEELMAPPPAALWNMDAPEGQCWKCPDCESWATLGGNAAFHRQTAGHGDPVLQAVPAETKTESTEINLLRKLTDAVREHKLGDLESAKRLEIALRNAIGFLSSYNLP